jgi:hypothetical protein
VAQVPDLIQLAHVCLQPPPASPPSLHLHGEAISKRGYEGGGGLGECDVNTVLELAGDTAHHKGGTTEEEEGRGARRVARRGREKKSTFSVRKLTIHPHFVMEHSHKCHRFSL